MYDQFTLEVLYTVMAKVYFIPTQDNCMYPAHMYMRIDTNPT